MKAFLIQFPFGIIVFNEENKLIQKSLFAKKPQEAAKTLLEIEEGKMSDETIGLISSLRDEGYESFTFDNPTLAAGIKKQTNIEVEISEDIEFRSRAEELAIETGFVQDAAEFSLWSRNLMMELAKLRVKGAVEQRDLVIGQAIQALDDVDRTVNLFMGRLREWYGVHFPEIDRLIEKHETYARLVLNLGERNNFTSESLAKEDIPKAKTEAILQVVGASMGAVVTKVDMTQIQALAKNATDMYELRKELESYMDTTMEEVAPNIKSLVGALLGARLIAIAGSLRNLAMRPASTIQVLGAEKALFRSLKTGARPPKHGLIFQAAILHDAKRWQRGKIARALAGKLSIAARADAFGRRYVGDILKENLQRRIEEIKERYKEPPPPKARPQQFQRREFGGPRSGRREKHWRGSRRRKDRRERES
jgi:nucleolar protein 56